MKLNDIINEQTEKVKFPLLLAFSPSVKGKIYEMVHNMDEYRKAVEVSDPRSIWELGKKLSPKDLK
jgi:hypothetical protein